MFSLSSLFRMAIGTRFGSFLGGGGALVGGGGGGRALGYFIWALFGGGGTKVLLPTAYFLAGGCEAAGFGGAGFGGPDIITLFNSASTFYSSASKSSSESGIVLTTFLF